MWRECQVVGRNIFDGLSKGLGLSPGNIRGPGLEVIVELLRNHRPKTSLYSFWRENHIGYISTETFRHFASLCVI